MTCRVDNLEIQEDEQTIICEKGPIFMMFWNCSYMSLSVNCPCLIFSRSSLSSNLSSLTLSISPSMSPIPRSLLMKGLVLKGSRSSMCSPVPMKMIGLFVAATLKQNQAIRNKSFMSNKG